MCYVVLIVTSVHKCSSNQYNSALVSSTFSRTSPPSWSVEIDSTEESMMRASNLGILLLVAAAAAAMATDLQNMPPSPDNGMEGGSCLSPDRMADFVEADEYCSEQCARSPPESGEEGESDSSEEDGDDRAPEDLIDYAEVNKSSQL